MEVDDFSLAFCMGISQVPTLAMVHIDDKPESFLHPP